MATRIEIDNVMPEDEDCVYLFQQDSEFGQHIFIPLSQLPQLIASLSKHIKEN